MITERQEINILKSIAEYQKQRSSRLPDLVEEMNILFSLHENLNELFEPDRDDGEEMGV